MAKLGALLFCVGLLAESAAGMRAAYDAVRAIPEPPPGIKVFEKIVEFEKGERAAALPVRDGRPINKSDPCELCDGHEGFSCYEGAPEDHYFGEVAVDFLAPDEAVNSFAVAAYGTACGRPATISFTLSGYQVSGTCPGNACLCGQCEECSGYQPPLGTPTSPVALPGFDPTLPGQGLLKVYQGDHFCAAYVKIFFYVHTVETLATPSPTEDRAPDITPAPTCDCSRELPSPVCGVDGQTYRNECNRRCQGTPKECDGPCPCPSASGDPHVTNMAGERFDINAPGEHVLLRLPVDRSRPALLELRGHVEADGLARACGMYLRMVTLRGDWLGNSTVQVRPLKRDMPGSNDAGTAVIWPFSIRESKATTDDGNWKSAADFISSGDGGVQVLSDSVKVAARQQAEEFGNGAASQAFEFVIKGRFASQASIVVSQGQRQSLNLQLKSLASLGERRLGGLLGTEPHSPEVEQKTRECMASESWDGTGDMRMVEPDSSRISASA